MTIKRGKAVEDVVVVHCSDSVSESLASEDEVEELFVCFFLSFRSHNERLSFDSHALHPPRSLTRGRLCGNGSPISNVKAT